jgi:hypothetical protein
MLTLLQALTPSQGPKEMRKGPGLAGQARTASWTSKWMSKPKRGRGRPKKTSKAAGAEGKGNRSGLTNEQKERATYHPFFEHQQLFPHLEATESKSSSSGAAGRRGRPSLQHSQADSFVVAPPPTDGYDTQ